MKDSLLERLMQLFDQRSSKKDKKAQAASLDSDVSAHANDWGELQSIENNTYFIREANASSKRVLCLQERLKLTKKSQQFLEFLIQLDVIGERTLELIMNQLLFSDAEFISLRETKWVVHQTLADGLDEKQLAYLNLILYSKEANALQH